MSLVDDTLKSEMYTQFADKLNEEDRKKCDDYLKEVLKELDDINGELLLKMSDNSGRIEFLDSLLYLFNSTEGHEEWLEKP
jgi:hypothetical protein|tara:strand:+ start:6543 stop:6785 length:243 start_codon:yes stop_codon:yes gene_type:complete